MHVLSPRRRGHVNTFLKIHGKTIGNMSGKRLFCELGPAAYAISLSKQIVMRKVKDALSAERFAHHRSAELLPVTVHSHSCGLIKRGPGIDMALQQGKAQNIRLACSRMDGLIIAPGETFSFWHLCGKTSRRNGFAPGRILRNGVLRPGVGGGLCNLANTIHLLAMHSPLTVTELHHHSDALAPDPGGVRRPYSAGTSVSYNYIDLRLRNDTDRPMQLSLRCGEDDMTAELRTTAEFPQEYRIVEENHHFHREADGNYYRNSRIYRETVDRATGALLRREMKWKNHSRVMFDPSLLPADQIR